MKRTLLAVTLLASLGSAPLHADTATDYQQILTSKLQADGPGMAVIVSQQGKTIYSGARGMANLELQVPLSTETVFRLGSITKQFTAAAIMILQEQDKLSVNDDLHKYVPDFPTEGHKITIANLLSHTSGIANYTEDHSIMEKHIQEPTTLDAMLKLFAKHPMHFAPGEQFRYSNTGYVLLGKVIEVASGQSYKDFVEKQIFAKLGMKNSYYGGRQLINNRAAGYSQTEHGIVNAELIDMMWPHAAGSLLSTVSDLNSWNQALRQGKLISTDSYQQMITPFVLNDGNSSGYGFGLANSTVNKYQSIGHNGGIPGFSTDAMYFPEKDTYIAVLSNSEAQNAGTLSLLFAAEALEVELPEFKPAKIKSATLASMMGSYKLPSGSVRTLSMEGDVVYSQRDEGHKWEIVPMSDNSFYYEGSLTYFTIDKNDQGETVMNFYSRLASTPEAAVKL